MIDQLSRFFSALIEIKNKCLKECLIIYGIMFSISLPTRFIIQRTTAMLAGTGWIGSTPWQIWHARFEMITKEGIPAILDAGESIVFFEAMYSSMQKFLTLSVHIILAGLAGWMIISIIRKKTTLKEALLSSPRPCTRFLGGMWISLLPLLVAGFIGTVIQVYVSTPGFVDNYSSFTPWSIAASALVLMLVYAFLRVSFLGYIRLESSERFLDSIKYSIFLSNGKTILIIAVMAPVVMLSMFLTYLTASIPIIKNFIAQLGILLVVIIETALFISLTRKQDVPNREKKKELLG